MANELETNLQHGVGDSDEEHYGDRMRRHLSGSIYLWACGEKSAMDVEDITLSDVLIGWLVPMLQGLAYIALIVRVKSPTENTGDSTGSSDRSNYSMASITGAMYLLVASTTPDLRAGFSLLIDGLHPYHHVFGFGLLSLYGLMITAAMKVLFTAADDDASVVINAVTVLFIADVDEKALSFFATVPQRWRLFWAIYTVGISFALALIGLIYVGDASVTIDIGVAGAVPVSGGNILDRVPSWFIWTVNPGAVTVCSFFLSNAVHAFAKACFESCGDAGASQWRMTVAMVANHSYKAVAKAKNFFLEEPSFCVVLSMWLVHGVVSWWFLLQEFWHPLLVCPPSSAGSSGSSVGASTSATSTGSERISLTVSIADSHEICAALIVATVALATGSVMKLLIFCMRGQRRPRTLDDPVHSSKRVEPVSQQSCGRFDRSFLPSILCGWGVGYLITSVLMGGSICSGGWEELPLALTIVGYVTIPCFVFAAVFLMADVTFLGTKFKPFLEITATTLGNKHGVWFWILATVIRDVLSIWVFMWYVLVPCLDNI